MKGEIFMFRFFQLMKKISNMFDPFKPTIHTLLVIEGTKKQLERFHAEVLSHEKEKNSKSNS